MKKYSSYWVEGSSSGNAFINWVWIYPTPPLQAKLFSAEYNWFEFRVLPSPRLVAISNLKCLVCPIYL